MHMHRIRGFAAARKTVAESDPRRRLQLVPKAAPSYDDLHYRNKCSQYVEDFVLGNPDLTPTMGDVIRFVARQTIGFGKASDFITRRQMVSGVWSSRRGTRLNLGTGRNPKVLQRACAKLRKLGILIVIPFPGQKEGDSYQLNLDLIERTVNGFRRPELTPENGYPHPGTFNHPHPGTFCTSQQSIPSECNAKRKRQHPQAAAAAEPFSDEHVERIRAAAEQVCRHRVYRSIAVRILNAAKGDVEMAEGFIRSKVGVTFDTNRLWWTLVKEDWADFAAEWETECRYAREAEDRRAAERARTREPEPNCPACSGEGFLVRPAHVPEEVWGLGARECYCCLPDPDARLTRYAELERLCRRPDPPPAPSAENPAAASPEASGPSGTPAATSGTPRTPKRRAADQPKAPVWSLADRLSRPPRNTDSLVAAGTIAASLMAEIEAPKGPKRPHASAAGAP